MSANSQGLASDHYRAGLENYRNNQFNDAADEFEKAYKIMPASEQIHNALSKTLMRKLNPPDTRRVIELFSNLANEQQSVTSLFWLGVANKHTDKQNASDYLDRALTKSTEIESQYTKVQDINNIINEIGKSTSNNTKPWWQNLVVFAVILILTIGALFVIKKWILTTTGTTAQISGPFSMQNIILFLFIALIFIFSALAMGWINAEQFTELFNSLFNKLPDTSNINTD